MIELMVVIFAVLSQIFSFIGTFLLKKGVKNSWINKTVLGGYLLYGLSTLFFLAALRSGKLSVVYPFMSLSYVGTTVLAVRYLKEKLNTIQIIGLGVIVIGVVLIGLSK